MATFYSKKKLIKELDDKFYELNSENIQTEKLEGFKSSLSLIMNYSKSLSVKSTKNIGSVYLNLN